MIKVQKYVDVILPLPLPGYYTYGVPDEYKNMIRTGCRIIVPFGARKHYTAIVVDIHHNCPEGYETKNILQVLDPEPLLLPNQLKFWDWLSSYYLCAQGDVYKAALPAGLKLESETRIEYNPEFEASIVLPEKEQYLLDILSVEKELSIDQLEKASKYKNVLPIIKSLLDRDAVYVKEELRKVYKPKTETRVRLSPSLRNEEQLRFVFMRLSRAHKQLAVLIKYLELSGYTSDDKEGKAGIKEVTKKDLLEKSKATTSVLNELVEKGILEIYEETIERLDKGDFTVSDINQLNDYQQRAYKSIVENFAEKKVCLLHGVTASGKTEVYIHLIEETINAGKQVLYLLPEIALTTQITQRLKKVFGKRLGIYHSKFPDAERVEIWQKQLREDAYDVILGARSSIFLPFRKLGLIIVDEEHENSYKQQDPAPRYHARNAAIMLASLYDARVLLGTATPSIESFFNASTGKYGFVELNERYKDIQLPEIIPVDIHELLRKKRMSGYFSPLLIEKIKEALSRKEQVILFQNRRGFAPMIECRTCGWVPKCKNCDVSLTYHKGINQLTCHYCGFTYQVPKVCPACEGTEMLNRGFGTEKVEDDIKLLFPESTVGRMDLDTTRTRAAYEKIIDDFENGRIDILIGTQMVSKGLDFDHVSVVGILNADTMLNFPDFRAYERSYQLMAQVAGRAGRKNKRGVVVLQTRSIDNPIIQQVITNDYSSMYFTQLAERQLFRYPPHYRLIYVYLKHKKADVLDIMARNMANRLYDVFGSRILGPDNPPVGRVQTYYIKKIIIKIEANASINKVREQLTYIQKEIKEDERFRSAIVYYDVDPV